MPFFMLPLAGLPTATGARLCLPVVALRVVAQVGLTVGIILQQPDLGKTHVILQLAGMMLSFVYFPLEFCMSYKYISKNLNEDDDDDRVGGFFCSLFVCLPFHTLNGALLLISFVILAEGTDELDDILAVDLIVLFLASVWLLPAVGLAVLGVCSLLAWLITRLADSGQSSQAQRTDSVVVDTEMIGAPHG